MQALRKILHVDDDVDIQFIARMSLESVGGFEVAQASSGADALDLVTSFSPDLILLDVMMPCMDGEETLSRLREIPGQMDTPVVFVTAKAHSENVSRLLGQGAIDVITKPFDPMTLPQVVQRAWDQQSVAAA
ncbi:response regulator [Tropicimonas sp. IMCC34011]|uniref:response regulator n=1 Tax=Tropicimonas sp. IMCC34011 TaxID=2248759 RepID=UPI000E273F1E|nr:response regulator [Tropicimonas sp. IMCC34011]